ncbi:MAG: molybdopterin oxidoreductase family protein [Sulfurovum sp.]|nr:molybdopterin oxidoreductase family protein [Sulfurovum sp.]
MGSFLALKVGLLEVPISEPFKESNWNNATQMIAKMIASTSPERVGFYSSGQVLVEDYYVANKLFKGFVGTSNIDSNSRTCIASSVVALQKAIGADIVPAQMSDVLHTDLIILIGANPAEAHVVFYEKYIKKALKEGKKLVVIDPRKTLSAKNANLHIPIKPGKDIDFLNAVAAKLIRDGYIDEAFCSKNLNNYEEFKASLESIDIEQSLQESGIIYQDFEKFINMIKESQKMVSVSSMGLNQSSQGVDKNLALFNLHFILNRIGTEGNGMLPETGQPNAMGGREVGALATMLSVHMDFSKKNREKVASFWKTDLATIPKKKGMTIMEMMEAAKEGKLDVLIIMHTDPVYSLPNRHAIEEALKNIPFVVEINAYDNTLTKEFVHMRLPAKPWGEKEGHHTNMERRISFNRAFYKGKGDAKEDWKILCEIAKKLGFGKHFKYKDANTIYKEFLEMTKLSDEQHMDHFKMDLKKINSSKENYRWGEEFFSKHKALTPNKKFNLHVVTNKHLSLEADEDYPFILLSIRTRDQWNSISKTGEIETLKRYKPLTFLEMHPHDAKELGISDGQSVRVSSQFGSVKTVVYLTEDIKPKSVAMPVSDRNINYLTSSIYDQESKEPDYNHTPVKIEKIYIP